MKRPPPPGMNFAMVSRQGREVFAARGLDENGLGGCPYCAAPITAHELFQPGHCGKSTCHQAHVAQAARNVAKRRSDDMERILSDMREAVVPQLRAAAQDLGVAPEDFVQGVVPHQGNDLATPEADARAAMEDHLRTIIAEAFATPAPDALPEERASMDADEPDAVAAACATCRGSCCKNGGHTFAFLTAEDIQHLRATQPDITPDAAFNAYTNRLPDASIQGSCLFHGAKGCTLTRAMRSEVCNTYRCTGLRNLVAQIAKSPDAPVAILSRAGKDPAAVGSYSKATGIRLQHSFTLPEKEEVTYASQSVNDDYADAVIAAAVPMVAEAAQAADTQAPAPHSTVVVPYQNRPLTPANPKDRAAFLSRLDEILEAGFAVPLATGQAAQAAEDPDGDDGRVAQACGTCQGHCCLQGLENHGFLDQRDIIAWRRAHPEGNADDLRAAYVAAIPEQSILKSCIFHGPQGCTMTRQIRSHTSNTFLCHGLKALLGKATGETNAIVATWRDKTVNAVIAPPPD